MSDASSQTPPPAKVAPAGTPDLASLFTLAVAVVVIAALYFAREVLIPITLAILLSFVLAPVVSWVRRFRVPHVPAVLMSVTVGCGLIIGISGLIGWQIAGLATDLPQYASTIEKKVATVRSATFGRLSTALDKLERQASRTETRATAEQPGTGGPTGRSNAPADAGSGALGQGPLPVPVTVQPPASQPLELARTILAPVIEPISNVLIVIIIAVFVLMQREDLRDRLIRLFGSSDLHRTTMAMDDAAIRLGRYFLAQLAINASFGVIIAIGLAVIGIPSPILWGIIGALLRFVPYIGAVIAAIIPATLAAAVFPGWSAVAWTLGLIAVVEAITGQVIEPLVYGHSTGLSPVAVVISAIFWTWIWGPVGLVLSTPLTLCLVVLGRHVDRLEFLDVLLGDRPALTPVENFYQRMLANDPDEAISQAELMLKDKSLAEYYDDVVVKGLRLAANDSIRGVMTDARLDKLKSNIHDLINDLADHAEPTPVAEPPAPLIDSGIEPSKTVTPATAADAPQPLSLLKPDWTAPGAILCVNGRGPVDDAASAMLVQLLGMHGLSARSIDASAASREQIGRLDPVGIKMVCVSHVEIGGSPAYLHYLIRRLRSRLRGAVLLVGLLPAEDESMKDDRLRTVIGADFYTFSLKETVETCLDQARSAEGDATEPGQKQAIAVPAVA